MKALTELVGLANMWSDTIPSQMDYSKRLIAIEDEFFPQVVEALEHYLTHSESCPFRETYAQLLSQIQEKCEEAQR